MNFWPEVLPREYAWVASCIAFSKQVARYREMSVRNAVEHPAWLAISCICVKVFVFAVLCCLWRISWLEDFLMVRMKQFSLTQIVKLSYTKIYTFCGVCDSFILWSQLLCFVMMITIAWYKRLSTTSVLCFTHNSTRVFKLFIHVESLSAVSNLPYRIHINISILSSWFCW